VAEGRAGRAERGEAGLRVGGSVAAYRGAQLAQIAFPLGGIGTGMITLGGSGQLRTWEVRNRPAKAGVMPRAFFAVRVRRGSRWSTTRVLVGPPAGRREEGGHSAPRHAGQGLPHFRECVFHGEFPIARVALSDPDVPVAVALTAFNPFIPLNPDDSSIPVAILLYEFENPTRSTLDLTVVGNLTNIVGEREGRVNEARTQDGLTGLWLSHGTMPKDAPQYGSLVLATSAAGAAVWPRWPWGGPEWQDLLWPFWHALAESEVFPPKPQKTDASDTGSVAAPLRLKPGESATVPFLIAWHFPTMVHWRTPEGGGEPATWKNYYATLWSDAWDAAAYTHRHLDRLRDETFRFHDALFASTLPAPVLDAVSSQLSVLKTPTCLRLTDGTFYGFEGTSDASGCCEGSCTHVWNYAQALPYLFPSLQRSMHEASFAHAMQPDGLVTFRLPLPLGTKARPTYHPAADGQMGVVCQVYREWLLSGDTAWLGRLWPAVRKSLDFAFTYWDADRDGVMEGMQHNTYDIEFHGPNPMMGGLYLAALRAAEEMARVLGRYEEADRYRALFEKGSRWIDQNLFNGRYYEQQVRPGGQKPWPEDLRRLAEGHGVEPAPAPSATGGRSKIQNRKSNIAWPRWQFGAGCLSDQLIGEWYAAMLGLGPLLKPANVQKALESVFRHNWRASLRDHPGTLRLYALNDEPGLIVCTWPKGGRPAYAFAFADEVWCGIEYQVASHLMYEGLLAEGLAVAMGVRQRHTGANRNPWDEFECGHHYARSMASYALLLALSGFHYSAADRRIEFAPRLAAEDFRTFFCVASGWGVYSQRQHEGRQELTLELRYGSLDLRQVTVGAGAGRTDVGRLRSAARPPAIKVAASLDRTPRAATVLPVKTGLAIVFAESVTLVAGQSLRIALEPLT
jgi:non-lysosomal glucosylceramidase